MLNYLNQERNNIFRDKLKNLFPEAELKTNVCFIDHIADHAACLLSFRKKYIDIIKNNNKIPIYMSDELCSIGVDPTNLIKITISNANLKYIPNSNEDYEGVSNYLNEQLLKLYVTRFNDC